MPVFAGIPDRRRALDVEHPQCAELSHVPRAMP
jgi:hypothetical protein